MHAKGRDICRAAVLVGLLGAGLPAAGQERPTPYFVCATSGVTISIPVGQGKGQHLYQDASGKWAPLPIVREAEGVVTFTLSAQQLGDGKTIVLLGKPEWLVAEDSEPPKVVKVMVDGKDVPPSDEINLGWLDAPPQTIELLVADDKNPLDPDTVCAAAGGRTVRPGAPGLEFVPDPQDKKKGRIVCSLDKLGVPEEGVNRVVIHCDDFAPDMAERSVAFAYTVTHLPEIVLDKPAATAQGVKIFVDSILTGYENVECLLDGRLQVAGVTTYGSTWASAETNAPHWVCLALPKPREVSGVEISWTNYQDTFWTSDHYAIMTWDGKQWATALKVQNNPAGQTSSHSFPPRTTDRVLVWVPAGGNHPGRPDLMWVTEVKLLP